MCNEESCERRAAYLHAYEDDFDNNRDDATKPLRDSIKALDRVRALHEPVDIYEYDDASGVFVTGEDGERVLVTRICRECSDEQAVEAVGDCEWWDGIYGNVYWPCSTVTALDGSDES